MGYIISRDKIKWWDLHIKKLKYVPSAKFDEYNNKWSPGSELMTGTKVPPL